MKNLVPKVLVASLLLYGLLSAWSCSKWGQDLAAPEDVRIIALTDHSVTIEWQSVKNATHYRWDCDSYDLSAGGVHPDNHLSLDILKPGTSYHFKVRAEDNTRTRPADGGDYPLYSDWTELDFSTPDIAEFGSTSPGEK